MDRWDKAVAGAFGAFVLWELGDSVRTVLDPKASEAMRFFAGRALGDFVFFGGVFIAVALLFWVFSRRKTAQ
jgi:hypothetical protein